LASGSGSGSFHALPRGVFVGNPAAPLMSESDGFPNMTLLWSPCNMRLVAMVVVANVLVWFLFLANQSTPDQLQHTQQERLSESILSGQRMARLADALNRRLIPIFREERA
jgi:hypothetical protein